MGVRGYGDTPEQAFEQAALALTAVITNPQGVEPLEQVDIKCMAPDLELLFADWLNALVYEMATRNMLFGRYEVHIAQNTLTGHAWGEPVDIPRHRPRVEVKGATYTQLRVMQEEGNRWLAQCIVDV